MKRFWILLMLLVCPMLLLAQNQSTNKQLPLTIAPSTLTITTTSLPSGKVGVAYSSTTLAASGGVAPYSWSVCTVAPCTTTPLPTGMTLSAAGVLSGMPTTACNCTITFQVTDNSGSIAKIDVNWQAPASGITPTAYNVKRGIASGAEVPIAQVPASITTFLDSVPKVSGIAYFYVATSVAGQLESVASNEVKVMLP